MANWSNLTITEHGEKLLTEATGDKTLEITKMKLGTGKAAGDPYFANNLADTVSTIKPSGVEIRDNTLIVEGIFTGNLTGKEIREIGIFGKADNGSEKLIAYANADNLPDWHENQTEKMYCVHIALSGKANVKLTVNPKILATKKDITVKTAASVFDALRNGKENDMFYILGDEEIKLDNPNGLKPIDYCGTLFLFAELKGLYTDSGYIPKSKVTKLALYDFSVKSTGSLSPVWSKNFADEQNVAMACIVRVGKVHAVYIYDGNHKQIDVETGKISGVEFEAQPPPGDTPAQITTAATDNNKLAVAYTSLAGGAEVAILTGKTTADGKWITKKIGHSWGGLGASVTVTAHREYMRFTDEYHISGTNGGFFSEGERTEIPDDGYTTLQSAENTLYVKNGGDVFLLLKSWGVKSDGVGLKPIFEAITPSGSSVIFKSFTGHYINLLDLWDEDNPGDGTMRFLEARDEAGKTRSMYTASGERFHYHDACGNSVLLSFRGSNNLYAKCMSPGKPVILQSGKLYAL